MQDEFSLRQPASSDVYAPDEIFLEFADYSVIASTGGGSVGSWVQWTLTPSTVWYVPSTGLPVDITTKHGQKVIYIGLGAGSPTSAGVKVDVYLDNLVVNGTTLLDDDTGIIEVRCGTILGNTGCTSIQDGVDAALPGDTISVAAGTYGANPTTGKGVYITKDGLSLIGESRDTAIIDGAIGGVGSSGSYWPKGIHVQANNVTVRNFTVQGFTGDLSSTGGYGILFRDYAHDMPSEGYIYYTGCVAENIKSQNNYSPMYALVNQNLTVQNCLIQNNLSDGMFIARKSDNATITGNTVINSGDHGIWVGNCWMGLGPSDNATITNNMVDGAREGGISFVGSDGATITGNTITNAKGEEPPAGWSAGALSLKGGVSNVTVSNNCIYGNDDQGTGSGRGVGIDGDSSNITLTYNGIYNNAGEGVKVMGTISGWQANNNDIYGNGSYDAQSTTASMLDFENNWWGQSPPSASQFSGPIDYDPWLSASTGVCVPTAIELASFTAKPGVGSVTLAWETGTEIDNAGFNLYRATAPDGPYTRINVTLIAAEGDPVAGSSYSFLDKGLPAGAYYYKLEDVDYYGVTTLHGPVSATVLPRFRRPAYRPAAPQ